MTDQPDPPTLADLGGCFEGAVPAVIATRSADGVPNVTYLSRLRPVDERRVALSNQFFSKTSRNLAEHPRASVLVIDPDTYDQWRLELAYERTERQGPVFDRLREDVDAIAAMSGMESVFRLRSADIYRVERIEQVLAGVHRLGGTPRPPAATGVRGGRGAVAELSRRMVRAGDLDTLVEVTLAGLEELLDLSPAALLLADESGTGLYVIASRGYPAEGVGSEVAVGDGVIGMAASGCRTVRFGNLHQMRRYGRAVRQGFEDEGLLPAGPEVPLPALATTQSRIAVPLVAAGELVGVLVADSERPAAFSADDEVTLGLVGSVLGPAIESVRAAAARAEGPPLESAPHRIAGTGPATLVRGYAADGSTFLDDEYLIKGVAGRVLVSLLRQHLDTGRVDFTNREVRLDPSLELPAFRDNLESRLILLKRRLAERDAPVQLERTGRGRFRLVVRSPVRLEVVQGSR